MKRVSLKITKLYIIDLKEFFFCATTIYEQPPKGVKTNEEVAYRSPDPQDDAFR